MPIRPRLARVVAFEGPLGTRTASSDMVLLAWDKGSFEPSYSSTQCYGEDGEGRRIPVAAISGLHFVTQEGLVCFSKLSTVDEFLRFGAIVSGLLLEGRRAKASGPQTGS